MEQLALGSASFYVRDVPATVEFYQRAFGIPMRYLHPSRGYAELATGATLLAFVSEDFLSTTRLLGETRVTCARPGEPPIGAQIALVSHDLDRDWLRAIEAGAIVLKPPEPKPWGQTVGYLLDLNGVIVELCTPSPRD